MTEAEIRNIIIGGGLGNGKFSDTQMVTSYDKVILEIGLDLIDSFRSEIEKNTRSTNGKLKGSLKPIPTKGGFDIEADYYYKFIDDGVSGVGQFGEKGIDSSRVPGLVTNGTYKFKNLGVPSAMVNSIREWSGASIEQSYGIAVNIKNYGIEPKNITDKVITDAVLERIAEDLATVTGLNIEARFNSAFDVK